MGYKTLFMLATLCFVMHSAMGQEGKLVISNISHEYARCAAYFSLISYAPDLDDETSMKYRGAGEHLLNLSAKLTSEKLALARFELELKKMSGETENSWSNVSIILNQYAYECEEVVKYPDERLKYWMENSD